MELSEVVTMVSLEMRFSGSVKDQGYCWSLLPASQSDLHRAFKAV